MRINTIGDLKEAIKDIPSDTKIFRTCDHAGIISYYLGYNFNPRLRYFKTGIMGLYEAEEGSDKIEFSAIEV